MRAIEFAGVIAVLSAIATGIYGIVPVAQVFVTLTAVSTLTICFIFGRWQVVVLLVACVLLLPLAHLSAESGAALFSILTAALLTALGLGFLWLMPVPRLPAPSGPHKAGLAISHLAGDRPLLLYVWYPAVASHGSPARRFHARREARAIASGLNVAGAPSFLHNNLRLVTSHSFEGAQVAEGHFPLVLFNHGGAMFPTQNFSLMQELASQGMVCISIGRPESLGLAWPDGSESVLTEETVALMKGSDAFQKAVQDYLTRTDEDGNDERYLALRNASDNGLTPLCELWSQDTMRALAALKAPDPTSPFGNLGESIDFDKYAYVGMSLGGAVSMHMAEQDEQALACVNLDGMNWSLPPLGWVLNVPCLQIYSDPNIMRAAAAAESREKPQGIALHGGLELYNDRFIKRSDPRSHRVILKGIGHMGLTDMALSVRRGFGGVLGLGSEASRSSIDHMNAIVASFLVGRFSQNPEGSGLDAVIAKAQAEGLVVPLAD